MNKEEIQGAVTDEFARLKLEYLVNGGSLKQWEEDKRGILTSVKTKADENPDFLNSLVERRKQMQKDDMTYRDALEMYVYLSLIPEVAKKIGVINLDIAKGNLTSLKEECEKHNILPSSKIVTARKIVTHVAECQPSDLHHHVHKGPVPTPISDENIQAPELEPIKPEENKETTLFNPRNNPFYKGR